MNTIDEMMIPIFEELNLDPIEFVFDERRNKYVTKEAFQYDYDDPEAYYIVIKVFNNIGTAVLGTSDGLRFYETEYLGQIDLSTGEVL